MEAIEEKGERTILRIKVRTGSKENKFPSGYDEWRKRICIDVTSLPTKGKANKEILSMLKKFFGKDAKIVYGEKSKEKDVLIEMNRDEVLKKIKNGL
ncbi:YggU family protein [Thermoplasmatales archaeon ex4484_30]|nr:MAG: YggU family protein [Thermoplasmatales archaeon ex4484_30]